MSSRKRFSRQSSGSAPRVGLFGNLGTGNIGNDASMDAILDYLRGAYPDAIVDAMTGGFEQLATSYAIQAVPMLWHQRFGRDTGRVATTMLKLLGKGIDIVRITWWVRRHDVVIIPGMGVLETSLPIRAWGFPYAMFLLCLGGRVFGTKVAFVSVGAGVIQQRWIRWFYTRSARLAAYRSYRNAPSRAAMQQQGVDTARDPVYPDVAFALPTPAQNLGDPNVVCLGVMSYHGSNDDRREADEIHSRYVDQMKTFVRWLVDDGRQVRLLIGDTQASDDRIVEEIIADLRQSRPDLDPSRIVAAQVATFDDVLAAIQPASSVVAIRFHNVLGALKLRKPTIAIGYSAKHTALMTDMGVAEFCLSVHTLDARLLIGQFKELESRSAELRKTLDDRNIRNENLLRDQFAELSAALFPATPAELSGPTTVAARS